MSRALDRPYYGCLRAAISLDDGPHGRCGHERNVDQRNERRGKTGPIDQMQPHKQRRELALFEVSILDEPRDETARRKLVHNGSGVGSHNDDDVVDLGLQKSPYDAREEGLAAGKREQCLGPAHTCRLAGSENQGRDHAVILAIVRECARIAAMTELDLQIRCQRCGTQMEMRDPGPGMPWTPDQFWVCPRCGRHFWSTYSTPPREKAKPVSEPPS